jgi:myo-inositol-1(or 4)-monophosphatase
MMPVARYERLAALAAATAREVGDGIDVLGVEIVKRKGGRANFATAADHAAEKAIIARLRKHDGGIAVLAEESATKEARRAERLWVVDPIDGTLNFSRAVPFYAVAIAYVEDGRVRAGAVHAPRTGETFIAHEGGGATLNGTAIAVSRVRALAQAFVLATPSRMALLRGHAARLRTLGAATLEIAYTAAGRFDLFIHPVLSPWDIAAAGLIAREAGATVLSLTTGEEAAWDEPRVIIGRRALVREALRTVPALMKPARDGKGGARWR